MARILIVEDAQIMRYILRIMLEKAGHEIVGNATNSMQALKMYMEFNPDLVTMDIQMEGEDGIMCLKEILQIDAEAKVVMVTIHGHGKKEREARSYGAVGYVSKPFQKEGLLEEIRNAFAE